MEKQKSRFSIISPVEHASSMSKNRSIIKQEANTTSDLLTNVSATESSQNNQLKTTRSKIMENFIVVWLCSNVNDSVTDRDDLGMQLQHIITGFHTFTEINQCIDFITDISDGNIIMIFNNYPDQKFLSLMDEIPQLHSIYIFNNYGEKQEQSTKDFKRVKGAYNKIKDICSAVKQDIHRGIVDWTPISIISSDSSLNLDELDPSFMYSQLLKEIIIDIKYDVEKTKEEFTQFCISQSSVNKFQHNTIKQFHQDYKEHSPIWWYTKEWFVYSSLNKALRTQDTEFITKMGFFVQHLHQEIEKKHLETHQATKMIVYRGQGLSNIDFEKLQKSKGGLLSYNSFLSTSRDRQVSLMFADSATQNPDLIGILFQMEIDPSLSSTPFISLDDISTFDSEAEILFSMHTVFRIGDINQIDTRLWEVNLILTDNNDQQLKYLTDFIRNEIGVKNGWARMALLMFKMGKYEKSLEIYNILTEVTSEEDLETYQVLQSLVNGNIGLVKQHLGDYSSALLSYGKALKFIQKFRPNDHTFICSLYTHIGQTYQLMGDFSSALLNYDKALEHQQQSLSPDSITLAYVYNNIATAHQSMGSFSSALSYFEKSSEILQTSLPPNHPNMALIHNNIGFTHQAVGDYSKALFYYEQTLKIQQKSLPSDHPNFAISYNNIGLVHISMGNYSAALSYLEKTFETQQKSLPSDHPHLARTHINIALIYRLISSFSSALSHLEKALEIQQKSLPSNHIDLGSTHYNIGIVHYSMGDFSIALFQYEQTVEIWKKTLPSDHPSFGMTYYFIGLTHKSLGNYSTARSYYEKALEIQQNSLPPHHPGLIYTLQGITSVSVLDQDYLSVVSNSTKAFEQQQKLLTTNRLLSSTDCNNGNEITENYSEIWSNVNKLTQIQQKLLSSDGSNSTINDENIADTENIMKGCVTMLSNMEKVFELQKKSPSLNHPLITGTHVDSTDQNRMLDNCMAAMSHFKKAFKIQQKSSSFAGENEDYDDDDNNEEPFSMNDFSAAMSYYQKALEIQEKYLPRNDVYLVTSYNNIGEACYSNKDYSSALSYFEKALDKLLKCSPINQQILAKTYNNISIALDGLDRYSEAIAYAKKGFEIAYSTLGSNHPETEAYRNHLNQLKRKLSLI